MKGPVLDGLAISGAILDATILSLTYETVTTRINMGDKMVGAAPAAGTAWGVDIE